MNQASVANNLNDHLKTEKEQGLNALFFDKVGLYLSLLAVVLIGIDTTANLLPGGSDLKCFIPSNASATKEQSDFVNAYCDRYLPGTKFSGFTVFLQSFITTALYLLWDAYKNYYVHKYAENTQEKAAAVSHLADAVSQLAITAVSKPAAPVSSQQDPPVSALARAVSKLAISQLTRAVSKLTDAVSVQVEAAPVSKLADAAAAVSKLADAAAAVSKLAAVVPQLAAPVPAHEAASESVDCKLAYNVSELAHAISQLSDREPRTGDAEGAQLNGSGTKYNLIISYYLKHALQFIVIGLGIIVLLKQLCWTPFSTCFDKPFNCSINFDHTWRVSSVQCDYTSVALSPIFLAIYFTISACIILAGGLALISIHLRMMMCRIDNDHFMRLIAVGDTANRAYIKLQELVNLGT